MIHLPYYEKTVFSILLMAFSHSAAAQLNAEINPLDSGMSGNPAAVNLITGSAALQKYLEKELDIQNNHGIRIGGLWLGDTNNLFSGGIPEPERWTNNSSFILDFSVDMEKMAGITGGLFDAQFLQFNGQSTNEEAGTVQGYNSLPGHTPLTRSELYQFWYRQSLLEGKLVIRVGKTAPNIEFDNVSRPLPLVNANINVPAVSGLIYTPIFVNPTMYGVLPGYYNSAYGITMNIAPIKQWYVSLGAYDGSLAQGVQTGIRALPVLDGSYFYIAETGLAWLSGKYNKPGYIGVGAWNLSGKITPAPGLLENDASGIYVYGTQRLWYHHPEIDNAGVSSFYQFGHNNSSVLPVNKFVGAGLTGFGLVPSRPNDSMGFGTAVSWLNQNIFKRRNELMYQAYYQAQIVQALYLEPVLSYIPTPGASEKLSAAWAGTMRAILLF